jgi:nucleolar protein 15
VSRSKKSTKSKGYAYLQFQHSEVAKIAAEAMNGYMMFGQTLKCHLVPVGSQHPKLFKHANRTMKKKPWKQMEADRHNKERTREEHNVRLARLLARDRKRAKRLAQSGIEYTYELQPPRKAKKVVFD